METMLDADRWPHIYRYEVACHCHNNCGYKTREEILAVIDPKICDFYELVRHAFGGHAITISSGVRCLAHQKRVGNAKVSPHVAHKIGEGRKRAYALDCLISGVAQTPRKMRYKIRELARDPRLTEEQQQMAKEVRIGWQGYSTFVHLDLAWEHPFKNEIQTTHWKKGGEW